MRSLKSRLFGFGVAAFFGTIVVVGCSASGSDEDLTATDANEPDTGGNKPITNENDGDETDPKDAGKKDAGKDAGKDAAKDAAPKDSGAPAPDEGDDCSNVNDVIERACGMCGKQQALCVANSNGTGGTVAAYGACNNQKVDGCVPGTVEDVTCGNCGTQKRTCSNSCGWTFSTCTGQPANSCPAGSVEFTNVSCDPGNPNLYRSRSCQSTCQWDNFPNTCSVPPTFITVPSTVGAINGTLTKLDPAVTTPRIAGTCPVTSITTTSTAYSYVEVRNTNPKAVTVSLYHSKVTGGSVLDTIIAAYDGTSVPTSDTARKACKVKVGDTTSSSSPVYLLTGSNSSFASIDTTGTTQLTIPANSSIMVYSAAYSSILSAVTPIIVNVRTESVAP